LHRISDFVSIPYAFRIAVLPAMQLMQLLRLSMVVILILWPRVEK